MEERRGNEGKQEEFWVINTSRMSRVSTPLSMRDPPLDEFGFPLSLQVEILGVFGPKGINPLKGFLPPKF